MFSDPVLTNDLADTAFVLVGDGFQTAIFHQVTEVIQRMAVAGQIIILRKEQKSLPSVQDSKWESK